MGGAKPANFDERSGGAQPCLQEALPNAIVGGALIIGFLTMLILESINW